jgi:hypothetical protein
MLGCGLSEEDPVPEVGLAPPDVGAFCADSSFGAASVPREALLRVPGNFAIPTWICTSN